MHACYLQDQHGHAPTTAVNTRAGSQHGSRRLWYHAHGPSRHEPHFVKSQGLLARQLDHLVEMGEAVNTLVAGDESGHNPEQLQAVRELVVKLNDDRCG